MSEDKIVLAENMIFANDMEHRAGINGHVLLVGPSGCGKTTSHIIPNMLHKDGSFVVVDYKGDLYHKFEKYYTNKGYIVRRVDLTNIEKSAHYNPIQYISTEQDIIRVAEILAMSLGKDEHDPFWKLSATSLLRGLISIVVNENSPDKRNMRAVVELMDKINIQETSSGELIPDTLFKYVKVLKGEGAKYRGLQDYLDVVQSAPNTYRSIVISLKAALSKFTPECVMKMMDDDDLDMESLATKRTIIFIKPSDTDSSLDVIATLLYTQLFQQLCRYADNNCSDNQNRLPLAVHFILDDFASGCPIPDMERIISNVRSRNITITLSIQSLQQLDLLYKENGKIIADNCDSKIFYSTMSAGTIEEASKLSNFSQERIRNMNLDEVLVLRRGEKPVLTKRYNTYSDEAFMNMKKKDKVL